MRYCAPVQIPSRGTDREFSNAFPSASAHRLRHTEYPHSLRSKHGDMKDTEGALWGSLLAELSPVDQEELAHLVAYCNTHKAPLPLSLSLTHGRSCL